MKACVSMCIGECVCVCVCESVSALSTSKGIRGWAAQDLLVEEQPWLSFWCSWLLRLEWEPFYEIYNILLRKKQLDQPQLSAWTCLCALHARLSTPLLLEVRVQGLLYLPRKRLLTPWPWAPLEPLMGQSMTDEAVNWPGS